jgi:hypothetical protein
LAFLFATFYLYFLIDLVKFECWLPVYVKFNQKSTGLKRLFHINMSKHCDDSFLGAFFAAAFPVLAYRFVSAAGYLKFINLANNAL